MFIPKESLKQAHLLDIAFQMTTTQDWDWRAEIFNETAKWVENYFLTIFLGALLHCSNGLCQTSKAHDWVRSKKSYIYQKLSLRNENTVLLVFIFILCISVNHVWLLLEKTSQITPCREGAVRNHCKQSSLPNPSAFENWEFCSSQSIKVDVLICCPLGRCYYTDYSFFGLFVCLDIHS